MIRLKLLALWILCTLAMPLLSLMMLIQVLIGSTNRAHNMAVAQDECGNAAFGGPPTQTMSSRVGDALVEGQKWATYVAPIIDFFFGKGHCLSNTDLPASVLNEQQKQEVDVADQEQGESIQY